MHGKKTTMCVFLTIQRYEIQGVRTKKKALFLGLKTVKNTVNMWINVLRCTCCFLPGNNKFLSVYKFSKI